MAVKVHDVLEGAQGTYLVWGIQNQFSMLGQDIVSDSIGVTLFQFGEDGRIIMQQDFWDSTEGFYQHIPVLGSVLRAIRDSFATE